MSAVPQKADRKAFEDRATIGPQTRGEVRDAVEKALMLLDSGEARVAEKIPGAAGLGRGRSTVAEEGGAAVVPPQRQRDRRGAGRGDLVDKIPSKFEAGAPNRFGRPVFARCPGCIVRALGFIARDAILMPSSRQPGRLCRFPRRWSTPGSTVRLRAQIGKAYLSGGSDLAGCWSRCRPTDIVEDDCFTAPAPRSSRRHRR